MLLYFHFRKNAGLISGQAFKQEDKAISFILNEIKMQIAHTKSSFGRACSDSTEIEASLKGTHYLTLSQIRGLIQKFEQWAEPIIGPAIIHEIKDFPLLKDVQ